MAAPSPGGMRPTGARPARGRGPWSGLRERLATRLAAWARRRQGEDALPVALERRRLYILPTRAGLGFGLLLFFMLLAGINYANSLALFLTFLLAAFALAAMHQCHRNLLGLDLLAVDAQPAFAGDPAELRIRLANTAADARRALRLRLPGSAAVRVDVAGCSVAPVALPLAARERGIHPIGRLAIETGHPFGLFRCWTWVYAPVTRSVYPRPHGRRPLPQQPGSRALAGQGGHGADEWYGLRPFREGDSPRQVDWKAYAREAPLLVKEYAAGVPELHELDYAALAPLDPEARLEQLCRWVLAAHAQGARYALRLPGGACGPGAGLAHRDACLLALAAFVPATAARPTAVRA